ncbi:hypothetical protein EDD11_006778 [Mortierella claussenii]|nr:hypothetical protein EDD11_006778 [Mortierella claussenii]
MSQTPLHAIDLDEICAVIADYLPKPDLVNCLCVSHAWYTSFYPHYWRTITVSPHKLARCSEASVLTHGPLIRSLSAGRIEDYSVFNQPLVSRLKHLEVTTVGSRIREDGGQGCLQEILLRNKDTLVSFGWRCYGQNTVLRQPYRLRPQLLAQLPLLTSLDLSNWSMDGRDFVTTLRLCPYLKYLCLDAVQDTTTFHLGNAGHLGSVVHQDGVLQSQQQHNQEIQTTLEFFTHDGLEDLTFIGNFVATFIPHVPHIRHLTLRAMVDGVMLVNQDDFAANPTCLSNLIHISVPFKCNSGYAFMTLLHQIPDHQLRRFDGEVPLLFAYPFLEWILGQHADTIERLEVWNGEDELLNTNPFRNGMFDIWKVFETCPKLICFELPHNLQSADGSYSTMESRLPPVPPRTEWICQDLRRLYLRLKDMDKRQAMDQITFNLCVDRLLPPEERRAAIGGPATAVKPGIASKTVLETIILQRLSGLRKLHELNIGNGWFSLPAWKYPKTPIQHH